MVIAREIAFLACPICRGSVRLSGEVLTCRVCSTSFPTGGDVPELFPWAGSAPDPEWARWRRKLALLEEWRVQTWTESPQSRALQESVDSLSADFFRFLRAPEGGAVLEIGCGNGAMRRYLPGRPYWGLDPLAQRDPEEKSAIFLRGVGERLPFESESFETVLLVQTLDHSFDPAAVLSEARRVMRPGGVLGVMQSLKNPPTRPSARARFRTALSRMRRRVTGRRWIDPAETKTHPLDREQVLALVGNLLRIERTATSGHVLFLRASRTDPTPLEGSSERRKRPVSS